MNILRKCRKCSSWIYIINKNIGDHVKCFNCGEEHHISRTLSNKITLTRI